MKKTLLVLSMALPIFAISNMTFASDYDCSSIDKTEIQEILALKKAGTTLTTDQTTLLTTYNNYCKVGGMEMSDELKAILEKKAAGTTLTTAEQATLDAFEAKMKSGSGAMMGSGSMRGGDRMKNGSGSMMNHSGALMGSGAKAPGKDNNISDEIKTILEKQKAGTTLTDAETAKLAAWQAQSQSNGTGSTKKDKKESTTTTTSGLSDAYKAKIDTQLENIFDGFSNSTTSEQITKLEAYVTKFEKVQTTISSSSKYSTTKKATYNSILSYILDELNSKIDTLNGTDTTSDDDGILDYLVN